MTHDHGMYHPQAVGRRRVSLLGAVGTVVLAGAVMRCGGGGTGGGGGTSAPTPV